MITKQELIEKVAAYDPYTDKAKLAHAYDFCVEKHIDQKRMSGEPYSSHPISVAEILADQHLDCDSIITALLHDTVEDTEVTIEDVEKLFGKNVAKLVDGVTKLSKIKYKSQTEEQADNYRKLIMATNDDIRVLIVKLADRLHNMRTLHFHPKPEKRHRIAHETMEIYAKLAERIGIHKIKEELQDLSFGVLHPEARETIEKRLQFLRGEGKQIIHDTIHYLEQTLAESHIKGRITGREKKPYSIWRKMQTRNISFEQLSDVVAFRVKVASIEECYQALGAVHNSYKIVNGYFKDYISTPKANGYQSLHTAVIGPDNQRIEIQIRTETMHEIAEKGVAAHWAYKQGKQHIKEGKEYRWIRELMEILEHTTNPKEVLENTELEMYEYSVFCFTPKGDLYELPQGATSIDFAYAVHSAVGNSCVGAKINGRIVPLRTKLHNGDQVEIIRSKTAHPSPDWEQFVVTGKAKSEIRKFVRTEKREEYITLGKDILSKAFAKAGFTLKEAQLEKIKSTFERDVDDIYAGVGEGTITRVQILDAVYPDRNKRDKDEFVSESIASKEPEKESPVFIKGLIAGMAIHFAKCCHPIYGDPIVGIVNTGKGVTIHTAYCDTLENFKDKPERWVYVSWDKGTSDVYTGRIKAIVSHESGSLATIANTIARGMGNITNLKIVSRDEDMFELLIDLEVKSSKHLGEIMASLRSHSVIHSVERQI